VNRVNESSGDRTGTATEPAERPVPTPDTNRGAGHRKGAFDVRRYIHPNREGLRLIVVIVISGIALVILVAVAAFASGSRRRRIEQPNDDHPLG